MAGGSLVYGEHLYAKASQPMGIAAGPGGPSVLQALEHWRVAAAAAAAAATAAQGAAATAHAAAAGPSSQAGSAAVLAETPDPAAEAAASKHIDAPALAATGGPTPLEYAKLARASSTGGSAEALVESQTAAEAAELRAESDRLRQENARLHSEDALLLSKVDSLQQSNADLRAEEKVLRIESDHLGSSVAAFARAARTARSSFTGEGRSDRSVHPVHLSIGTIVCMVGITVLLLTCFFCFHWHTEDDEWHEGEDEEEYTARKLRDMVEEDHSRSCCWCVYHPRLMTFICGVLVVTFLGGCILWQMGLLQPLLAQCIMYVYVMLVVVAFISVMISRLWSLVRRLVNYLITEFQRMKDVFRIFGKKPPRFAGHVEGLRANAGKAGRRPDFWADERSQSGPLADEAIFGKKRRAETDPRSAKRNPGCVQS